ncbi:MAG: VIT1/CCC1 transporter family protein [Candidatus Micrarchaeia archaeon]|jgi:VIT1/CCC1 family predicted Fe2+/Mn2+ transporter
MKQSLKIGLSFGLTSAVITTLGLIVGLNAGTHSKLVIIGGIITIAVADAFSDALGIHISEESQKNNKDSEIWESTISTFICKFIFALTFLIPILLFDLSTAIIASIIWGLLVISILSYKISKTRKTNPWETIGEHLFIAMIVILITNFIGQLIPTIFV